MWGGLTGLLMVLGGNAGRKIDQNKVAVRGGEASSTPLIILAVVLGLPAAFLTWMFPIPMGIVDVIGLAIFVNAFR